MTQESALFSARSRSTISPIVIDARTFRYDSSAWRSRRRSQRGASRVASPERPPEKAETTSRIEAFAAAGFAR